MKLSDFTLETFNVALDGAPPEMGEWQTGSRSTQIGRGRSGGKKYQIKMHVGEPKWYNTDKEIARKTAEMNASKDSEAIKSLSATIDTLKNNKAKNDERDAVANDYFTIKQNLVRALNAIGDPLIVGPADFWREEVASRGGAEFAIEATPWLENVAVGFEPDSPLMFSRDLDKKQQYAIVASLAERLAVLHKAGIIHADLKIGNTLITKVGGEFKAALIDFDAAILLKDLHSRRFKFGAWYYIVGGTFFAPEFIEFFDIVREECDEDWYNDFDLTTINEKADIFGLGITIYEYFHGRADMKNPVPFIGPDGDALDCADYGAAMAQADYKPDFPASMDDFMYGMLNWMLAKDPAKRPTAELVAKAFKTEDSSLIPGEFTRNPLWEEHRDEYEVIPGTGVDILRASKPRYKIKKDGMTVSCDINRLVADGYVKMFNPPPPPPPPEDNKYWPCDGTGELPPCAKRAPHKEGFYKISMGSTIKVVNFKGLKDAGIICTDDEIKTLWPCEANEGWRYTGNKTLRRNMAFGKGPGHYLIGDTKITSIKYTADELKNRGLLVKGVDFALWAGDAGEYEPNPDGVPDTVKTIVRNTVTNHQYRIIYYDGRIEKLMIADMLARGYVKKK